MKSRPRTAASIAISGLANSDKIYKGYSSYEGAHCAWDGFASTGQLPHDIAASLGSKPYPTPPISSAPPGILAPPTTPQHVHVRDHHSPSSLISQTPLTPRRGHSVATPFGPSSSRTPTSINTSPSAPRTPISTQSRNAAALAIVREEALRADKEDFWVVFTGIAPGVHQGR
jgi:hypothetical protein